MRPLRSKSCANLRKGATMSSYKREDRSDKTDKGLQNIVSENSNPVTKNQLITTNIINDMEKNIYTPWENQIRILKTPTSTNGCISRGLE